MAACDEGRSTVTGTRRSRSQGEATLAVRSARPTRARSDATPAGVAAPERGAVSAQNSAIAVQPPNRCGQLEHVVGAAAHRPVPRTPRRRRRAPRARRLSTRVVTVTLSGARTRATVATQVNAHSHAVPASAAPAWIPPTWWTCETLQRTHSGHERDPRPASAEDEVEDVLLPDEDGGREVDERQRRERGQRAAVVDPPVAAIQVMREHGAVEQRDAEDEAVVRHDPTAPGGRRGTCRGGPPATERRRVSGREHGTQGAREAPAFPEGSHSSRTPDSGASFPTRDDRVLGTP